MQEFPLVSLLKDGYIKKEISANPIPILKGQNYGSRNKSRSYRHVFHAGLCGYRAHSGHEYGFLVTNYCGSGCVIQTQLEPILLQRRKLSNIFRINLFCLLPYMSASCFAGVAQR